MSSMPSASSREPASSTGGRDRTLPAASFGTAIVLVAFTMPLGLMAAIVPDLAASASGRTWILSSMSVGLASALLVAGSLADDLGRRRIFLLGLGTFAAGSFVVTLAQSVTVVSVARGIQGLGGAALLASALSLIAHATAPGPARAHATGIWGAMLGAGIAIGPIAGSLLAELGDWHTPYAVLTVVSLVAIVPTARMLQESRSAERKPIDPLGATLLAVGLVAFTAGIVQGNTAGWGSATVLIGLLGGAAVLALFALHELRTHAPLFDVRLLARPAFTAALAGSFALGFTVLAFMSYAMTFTQTALGATAVAATFWGLPWAAVSFLVALKGRVLAGLMSRRVQVTSGLIICGLGLFTMLGVNGEDSALRLVPGFVVMGVGTGFLNAGLAQAAVSVVPPARSGMGAGANNTARYLGAALGVALVIGSLHAGTQHRAAAALAPILEPSIASPLAEQIADGGPRPATAGFQSDANAAIDRIAKDASASAMNTVIRTTALITFAGAAACFALMRPRTTFARDDDDAEPASLVPPPSTEPVLALWLHHGGD